MEISSSYYAFYYKAVRQPWGKSPGKLKQLIWFVESA
jgi:hypothetical protein